MDGKRVWIGRRAHTRSAPCRRCMCRMLNIVVSGGSGYLGQFVVAELARLPCASKLHVVALYCSQKLEVPPSIAAALGSFAATKTDITSRSDVAALLAAIDGAVDVVVHCAALTSIAACEQDPAAAASTNCPAALLDAVGAARILYTSTDIVYGGEKAPYAESAPGAAEPLNEYGRTKLECERAIAARWAAGRFSILRCSNMLGPPSPFTPRRTKFVQWLDSALGGASAGASDGDGGVTLFAEEVRSFVAVTDVAALLAQLATAAEECALPPVICCGGGEGLSRVALAAELAALRAYSAPRRVVATTRAAHAAAQGVPLEFATPRNVTMRVDAMRALLGAPSLTTAEMLARCF